MAITLKQIRVLKILKETTLLSSKEIKEEYVAIYEPFESSIYVYVKRLEKIGLITGQLGSRNEQGQEVIRWKLTQLGLDTLENNKL